MNTQNFQVLEKSSTLFLKVILLVLSIGVLVFCGFLLYQITQSDSLGYYPPIVIGVAISTIPLLYIFYQAFNLLNNIDKINLINLLRSTSTYLYTTSTTYYHCLSYYYYLPHL
jgi:hypothetical protein